MQKTHFNRHREYFYLQLPVQPIQRLQPNFVTNGIRNFIAQQKQRKPLILTDSKNIFTSTNTTLAT